MKKFEYKTLEITKPKGMLKTFKLDAQELEKKFNALGRDGWRLAQKVEQDVEGWTSKVVFVFERESGY
ncbi:MAG: DUF4177 domain-containing protein [Bacteroidota bacterium]